MDDVTKTVAIIKAIKEKKHLAFLYNGTPRVVCPHILGTKKGEMRCLAYQVEGGTSSGHPVGANDPNAWRCFVVDRMTGIRLEDGEWCSISSHSQNQNCIDVIVEEVSY